ncbi:MAG: hypothetical protein AB8I08_23870 [Sandaracinaceae bacterium]
MARRDLALFVMAARLLSATALGLLLASCAGQECDFNSQCGELRYCERGRCRQDCRVDLDCAAGETCSPIGQCEGGSDGGARDAGALDAAPPRDAGRDAGRIDGGPADAGPEDAGPPDGGLDAGSDAGRDGGLFDAGASDAGSDAGGSDAGPSGPVGPGTYLYRRLPIGGLNQVEAIAFHPDGSYALVVERNNEVQVVDWGGETATQIDLRAAGRAVVWRDVLFSTDGSHAFLVGYETAVETGVIVRFDDTTWRSAGDATAFTRVAETRAGERFTGIALPHASGGPAGDGRPVVLSSSGSSPGYIARLRELDPATDTFSGLVVAQATAAGCDDLAFVDNEFGGWGIVVVCGSGFADTKYYTEIGGVGEWRPAPAATLGNTARVDAHPSGEYALAIGWSGRRVHRHRSGTWGPTSGAPWFTTQGIWDVSFAPDGQRALVVGRTSVGRGTVLEFRHDLYAMADITDVSVPAFDEAPYNADSNTYLYDSAFRPGCDGGLIGGGNFSAGSGLLIEFSIEGGVACR